MKLTLLTNSRPSKNYGKILMTSVTKGQIKISMEMADTLGVVEGDRIAVGKDAEQRIFVYKGDDKLGAKLAKTGHFLVASTRNVWDVLDGNTETKRIFEVDGDVVESDDSDVVYVPISFKEDEEKITRTSLETESEQVTESEQPSDDIEEM